MDCFDQREIGGPSVNSSRLRNGFVYVLILVAIGAILYSYRSQSVRPEGATITDVANALKAKDSDQKITQVKVSGDRLTVYFEDGSTAATWCHSPSAICVSPTT